MGTRLVADQMRLFFFSFQISSFPGRFRNGVIDLLFPFFSYGMVAHSFSFSSA